MLILFDLDGTVIDSETGIVASMQYAFEQMGVPAPPVERLREWIGPPLRVTFPHAFGTPERVDAAVAHYLHRFASIGWSEYVPYAGIEEVVRSLTARGYQLGVVTAKILPHARRIVDHLPFGDCFSRVYGPAADGPSSAKQQMIAQALRDFDVSAADTVMIGDRLYDMEGARANDVRALGAGWGFGSPAELLGAGAERVVASPRELLDLL